MHYVNFSYNSSHQNVIACQIDYNIYFYTIKPIPPNTELLVWYCREYAERLNVPKTGEEMLQAWSKWFSFLNVQSSVNSSHVIVIPYSVHTHTTDSKMLDIYWHIMIRSFAKHTQTPLLKVQFNWIFKLWKFILKQDIYVKNLNFYYKYFTRNYIRKHLFAPTSVNLMFYFAGLWNSSL